MNKKRPSEKQILKEEIKQCLLENSDVLQYLTEIASILDCPEGSACARTASGHPYAPVPSHKRTMKDVQTAILESGLSRLFAMMEQPGRSAISARHAAALMAQLDGYIDNTPALKKYAWWTIGKLTPKLRDNQSHVRYYAAMALGKLYAKPALNELKKALSVERATWVREAIEKVIDFINQYGDQAAKRGINLQPPPPDVVKWDEGVRYTQQQKQRMTAACKKGISTECNVLESHGAHPIDVAICRGDPRILQMLRAPGEILKRGLPQCNKQRRGDPRYDDCRHDPCSQMRPEDHPDKFVPGGECERFLPVHVAYPGQPPSITVGQGVSVGCEPCDRHASKTAQKGATAAQKKYNAVLARLNLVQWSSEKRGRWAINVISKDLGRKPSTLYPKSDQSGKTQVTRTLESEEWRKNPVIIPEMRADACTRVTNGAVLNKPRPPDYSKTRGYALIPTEIGLANWRTEAAKDPLGAWEIDSERWQTKQQFRRASNVYVRNFVTAPTVAGIAVISTAALVTAGGGVTLARGAGRSLAKGFGRLVAWGPGQINRGLAMMTPAFAKTMAGVIWMVAEGLIEAFSCEFAMKTPWGKFRPYDQVLKHIDPTHYFITAIQRAWPGGKIGKFTRQGEEYGGYLLDFKNKKEVYTVLDYIDTALMTEDARVKFNMARGTIEDRIAYLHQIIDEGACENVAKEFAQLQEAKEMMTNTMKGSKMVMELLNKYGEEHAIDLDKEHRARWVKKKKLGIPSKSELEDKTNLPAGIKIPPLPAPPPKEMSGSDLDYPAGFLEENKSRRKPHLRVRLTKNRLLKNSYTRETK